MTDRPEHPSLDIEVGPSHLLPGAWQVDAVHHAGDGEIYTTIFIPPLAEERARVYAGLRQMLRDH